MALSLAPSADGLSVDLKLGSTVIATFSANGIEAGVLIANAATAQALTNNKQLLTPAALTSALGGGNQSLSGTGYQKLPGGLIIQWANNLNHNAVASQTVTFPIAFPNACLNLNGYQQGANQNANVVIAQSTGNTTTQGTFWFQASTTSVFGYFAIGY